MSSMKESLTLFYFRLSQKILPYERRYELNELIHNIPDWTTLQTLGQSRIMGLTIIAPFIGSLILFNDNLVSLLEISPQIVERWLGVKSTQTSEIARLITINRLEITYFGLVSLGFASFLFKLFCPGEIKKYSSVSEYIEGERELITNARRSRLVWSISNDFRRNHSDADDGKQSYLQKAAYPTELQILFHSVVEEITENLEGEDQDLEQSNESESQIDEIDHDPFNIRVGPRSSVHSGRVAEILWAQRAVERIFWLSFYSKASEYLIDLLTIRYNALSNSRPSIRLSVSAFYGLGFGILLVPTIHTFVIIMSGVFIH